MALRGTLYEKELRQNVVAFLGVWVVVGLLIFGKWSVEAVGEEEHEMISLWPWLYWGAFVLAALLGACFLTDETVSGEVNFLLRLPVRRSRIFLAKVGAHLTVLALAVGAAFDLVGRFAVPAAIGWEWPEALRVRDLCLAFLWVPMVYFLAVCISLALGRIHDAVAMEVIAVAASIAIVLGLRYCAGFVTEFWVAPWFSFRVLAVHIVVCVVATILVAGEAAWAMWLLSRKEGR